MQKECIEYRKLIFELIRKKLKYEGFQNILKTISEKEINAIEIRLIKYEIGDIKKLI